MKLHLGCGKRFIPGFIHIDAVDYPHVDHVSSIDHLSFIQDGTVDLIYNCHVLEHFKRREVDRVLQEWRRVLKPGGVLLVAVPHISMFDPNYHEIWRFTPEGLANLLGRVFGTAHVTLRTYGNSLTAAGEIRGVVADEFSRAELDNHDPRFALEVCARAVTPN